MAKDLAAFVLPLSRQSHPSDNSLLPDESLWQLPYTQLSGLALSRGLMHSLSICSSPSSYSFLAFLLLSPSFSAALNHSQTLTPSSLQKKETFSSFKPGQWPAEALLIHISILIGLTSRDSNCPNFDVTHFMAFITCPRFSTFSQAIPLVLPSSLVELPQLRFILISFLHLTPADYIGEARAMGPCHSP